MDILGLKNYFFLKSLFQVGTFNAKGSLVNLKRAKQTERGTHLNTKGLSCIAPGGDTVIFDLTTLHLVVENAARKATF